MHSAENRENIYRIFVAFCFPSSPTPDQAAVYQPIWTVGRVIDKAVVISHFKIVCSYIPDHPPCLSVSRTTWTWEPGNRSRKRKRMKVNIKTSFFAAILLQANFDISNSDRFMSNPCKILRKSDSQIIKNAF